MKGFVMEEFECGCLVMKESEWKWQFVTCLGHSKKNPEGGVFRYINLTKPIKEMIHP